MKFLDAKSDNYSRLSPDSIAMHQYIEDLATRVNVNLETWDLSLFVLDPLAEVPVLVQDKNQANKIFFNELGRLNAHSPTLPHIDATGGIFESATQAQQLHISERREQLVEKHRNSITNANAYYQRHLNSLADASTHYQCLLDLSQRKPDIAGSVKQILADGFWQFLDKQGDLIRFISGKDIVVTHTNPAASVSLRVNFGKMIAAIDLKDNQVLCFAGSNSRIRVKNFPHPHINSNGVICFGDAKLQVIDRLSRFDYAPVFRVLHATLYNYNPANPYVPLSHFQAKQPENAPPGTMVMTLCATCDEPESLCQCHDCDICGESQDSCDCCRSCHNTPDNCECCGDCGEPSCTCPLCPDPSCQRRPLDCDQDLCEHCNNHTSNCDCQNEDTQTPSTNGEPNEAPSTDTRPTF